MLNYKQATVTPNIVVTGSPILISIDVSYEEFTFDKLTVKNISFLQLDSLAMPWSEFQGGDWKGGGAV